MKYKIKDLKKAIDSLNDDMEFEIINTYKSVQIGDTIDVLFMKEMKKNGRQWYQLSI